MTILEWLSNLFKAKRTDKLSWNEITSQIVDCISDIWAREMAFWSAVNLQAAALGQCEFRTYQNGKEVQGREYYIWNVEPNKNQNRQEWLRELVAKLYRNNEALVIDWNGDLLIADSFQRVPYALYGDTFKDVKVKDFAFQRTFVQSETLYLKLNSQDMRAIIEAVHNSYAKLLTYTMTAYQRSRGTKGIFQYDSLPKPDTEERRFFDSLINERIGTWLKSDSAALPLGNGQKWQELQQKTYNSENTRDIRALVDDIQDYTCRGFGIPPALLRGDVAGLSDAIKLWLTASIEPLAGLIEEEINRKRNGYEGFAKGNRIEIYTGNIEHHDLLNSAPSIDKLISSGWSPNEVRRICGEPQIDEEWANQHYITKNYEPDSRQKGGTA